jgi:hypothetical protein
MPPFGVGGTVDAEGRCYNNWYRMTPDEWIQMCQFLSLGGQAVYNTGAKLEVVRRLCENTSTQEPFRVCSRLQTLPLFKAECSPKASKPLLITKT